MYKNKLDKVLEVWNKRTSTGQTPHVSTDSFGGALRDANRRHKKLIQNARMKKQKIIRDKLTAMARSKSYDAAQKNK